MTPPRTQDADLILAGASQVVTFRGVGRGEVSEAVAASTLTDASVAMAGGRILGVGPSEEISRRIRLRPGGEILPCHGQVILPGLLDAHTHLPFAGHRADEFRRRLAGQSYEATARAGGGIRATLAATRQATEEELVDNCLTRMDRMLLHGVTTAEAKSGYGLDLEAELKQLRALAAAGQRHPLTLVPTLLAAHIVPPEMSSRHRAYLDLIIREILPAVVDQKLARFCDVFVDRGAFSVAEAGMVLKAARDQGLGLRVHADQLSPGGGAELAAREGAASADHLEHVSRAGMDALARAGTVAVLLPAADLFLGKPSFPPARELLAAGVAVALATDCNPGSCMTENLPLCASLACMTTGMDTDEALAGLTLQAARSLGLQATHGTLEVGKHADLAVFAVPDRTQILYHFGINHCLTVVKEGRVVVREGRVRRT